MSRNTIEAVWHDARGRAALIAIAVVALASIFAPLLTPYDARATIDIVGAKYLPPSWAHPFGTDRFSRDVMARVLMGGRISLAVGGLAVIISGTIGTAYGLAAGLLGGWIDAVMMRVLDALLAIPRVLLLLAILALWQPVPLAVLVVVIGATGWLGVSRLVRAEVRSARELEYVGAARALGATMPRIAVRHILPNVTGPVLVAGALGIANVIALEAGLSFLGVGVQEPNASWGTILLDGTDAFASAWWISLFPTVAIVATVVAFNVLGDVLRDVLDPRQLPD